MFRKAIRRTTSLIAGLSLAHAFIGSAPLLAADKAIESAKVIRAVAAAIAAIEKGTLNYADQRSCFTCHHQTLPMLAQAAARAGGFKINEDLFRQQTKITHDGFKNRHDKLRSGKGIGGQSMTVAYALWALDIAKWKPDETTEAMVAYLIKTQKKDGRFYTSPTRPPLEDSPAASATLAAYYLQEFASDGQAAEAATTVAKARKWLIHSKPERQEDINARLWGLHLLDADAGQIAEARKAVLASQREDGGWSQLPDMVSDSYATGQALWMLSETGFSTDHPVYQRGVQFLLDTQLEDGSWRVKTRSKPIQTYFESGFPHGKDQFISICGTSWAVAALAKASPRAKTAKR